MGNHYRITDLNFHGLKIASEMAANKVAKPIMNITPLNFNPRLESRDFLAKLASGDIANPIEMISM